MLNPTILLLFSRFIRILQELQKTDPDLIALQKQKMLEEKISKLPPWQQELMKKKHGLSDPE